MVGTKSRKASQMKKRLNPGCGPDFEIIINFILGPHKVNFGFINASIFFFLRQVNAVTGLLFSQHVMEHANQNNPDEQMKENEENKDDSSEQVS